MGAPSYESMSISAMNRHTAPGRGFICPRCEEWEDDEDGNEDGEDPPNGWMCHICATKAHAIIIVRAWQKYRRMRSARPWGNIQSPHLFDHRGTPRQIRKRLLGRAMAHRRAEKESLKRWVAKHYPK